MHRIKAFCLFNLESDAFKNLSAMIINIYKLVDEWCWSADTDVILRDSAVFSHVKRVTIHYSHDWITQGTTPFNLVEALTV
jgi:hypothetical protein